MKINIRTKTLTSALVLLAFSTYVQAQDIRGALIGGFNISQVDGDGLGGYKKLGLNLGGSAIWYLNEKLTARFEILFTQKGSLHIDKVYGRNTKLKYDYIEIPIVINFVDKGTFFVGGGLGIGVLVNDKTLIDGNYSLGSPKNRDYSLLVDIGFMLKENIALNFRYQYSIPNIGYYPNGSLQTPMRNNVVLTRLMYILKSR